MIQQYGIIAVERGGFSQIIETGPHKLTAYTGIFIQRSKFLVGQASPSGFFQIISRHLKTAGEIFTARTHSRTRFAGQSGQMFMSFFIQKLTVKIRSPIYPGRVIHAVNIDLQFSTVHGRPFGI